MGIKMFPVDDDHTDIDYTIGAIDFGTSSLSENSINGVCDIRMYSFDSTKPQFTIEQNGKRLSTIRLDVPEYVNDDFILDDTQLKILDNFFKQQDPNTTKNVSIQFTASVMWNISNKHYQFDASPQVAADYTKLKRG